MCPSINLIFVESTKKYVVTCISINCIITNISIYKVITISAVNCIIPTSSNYYIITVIASWPAAREDHWVTLLKARAIENQAYIVGVNRCGTDPKLDYTGRTQIIDYQGNILADARDIETVITAQLAGLNRDLSDPGLTYIFG